MSLPSSSHPRAFCVPGVSCPRGCRHKDGGHFRHFLDSPEQGLLTLLLWSDMLPKSGGTFCALDSVGVVARFLADHPEGVHADSVQGTYPFRARLSVRSLLRLPRRCLRSELKWLGVCSTGSGYLIPGLIRECQQLVELTGDQGDVVLMHPFVMHRVSGNPSGRARFGECSPDLASGPHLYL